jgi:amino acid transporter
MREAVMVVGPMPSPRKKITFFAVPAAVAGNATLPKLATKAAIRIFFIAASKSAIQIMIPMIVFGFLLPTLVSVAALFILFRTSERLEHPILIIFAENFVDIIHVHIRVIHI